MTRTFHICDRTTVFGFEAGVWEVFGELLRRSDGEHVREVVAWLNDSAVSYVIHGTKTKKRRGYQSKYSPNPPDRAALFRYDVTLPDDASAIHFKMMFPDLVAQN